jgi:hypothetical protein
MKTLLYSIWGWRRKRYCPNCTEVYEVHDTEPPYDTYYYSDNPVMLILKEGKWGKFWGCPNFPKCKYSENAERKKVFIDWDDDLRPY